MAKGSDHSDVERFGGPGSSHQDRDHPGKNKQPTGHKGGEEKAPPMPGSAMNRVNSAVGRWRGARLPSHADTSTRSDVKARHSIAGQIKALPPDDGML
jgi:hypothetical protein